MTEKITAYALNGKDIFEVEGAPAADGWVLRPASHKREWMNENGGHAYRCLPLVIANQMGWVVECPITVTAVWNGSNDPKDTVLSFDGDEAEKAKFAPAISSHFGYGIVTFNIPWIFRTPDGVGLCVRGITNSWKDGAIALDAYVETDWLPYPFFMSWRVIRPDFPVTFVKGEPICMIYPHNLIQTENMEAEVTPIEENESLADEYGIWRVTRNLGEVWRSKLTQKWRRRYVQGRTLTDQQAPDHHTTRIKLSKFDKR
jgi:hypothetical protein